MNYRVIGIFAIMAAMMIGAVAMPLVEQHANAANFKFGNGNFFQYNDNGHLNFKYDGFHFVR